MQHNTTRRNTTQRNTTQHITTQHSTTQHDTTQCNTKQTTTKRNTTSWGNLELDQKLHKKNRSKNAAHLPWWVLYLRATLEFAHPRVLPRPSQEELFSLPIVVIAVSGVIQLLNLFGVHVFKLESFWWVAGCKITFLPIVWINFSGAFYDRDKANYICSCGFPL